MFNSGNLISVLPVYMTLPIVAILLDQIMSIWEFDIVTYFSSIASAIGAVLCLECAILYLNMLLLLYHLRFSVYFIVYIFQWSLPNCHPSVNHCM